MSNTAKLLTKEVVWDKSLRTLREQTEQWVSTQTSLGCGRFVYDRVQPILTLMTLYPDTFLEKKY